MILNAHDLRKKARQTLPGFAFDYIDGGADDEYTLRHNTAIFDRWMFTPSVLKNASQRDLSVNLQGTHLSAPLMVAPTGYNGMLRRHADHMLASAASHANIGYMQSTVSTAALEDVHPSAPDNHWFQLYVLKDREITLDLLKRAQQAGCKALVVSVDAVHFGNRERDKRHYRRPMKLSWRALAGVAMKPGWVIRTLLPGGVPGFGNLQPYLPPELQKGAGGASYFASQMDKTLDWATLEWLRARWQGPLLIKGIMTAQDARQAQKIGADGIVLSNHGGRQLDSTLSPMDVLSEVRNQVGPDFTLLADSGFRRGTDVVKALALGANAVLIGRPLLYAVAAGGEALVQQTLTTLIQEIDLTLAQLGCTRLDELHPGMLRLK
ncbi:mandelate dehydrogenase [Mangrovibacter sp. MFB070]|uniref:alpha-hydroxy acid oxidase n=1 Tax=Mangrovibacter sp. MFB070 TaxID=1224318 RepID=UPI0004D67430|nr:alpha-hydroxy acid oxidase [Mangrovibacter sp. MFB070]KEA51285.1 mandelate dehydrogenase [Mangrovibacter sp. MFB070]